MTVETAGATVLSSGPTTLQAKRRVPPPCGSAPRPSVTVIMPCLNEAASVARCVDEALGALHSMDVEAEVLVVDNGSSDGSPALAAAAGARVIVERRRGYGAALRSGVRAARGEIVVMADADCTYDLSSVARLVGPVAEGKADLVIGSRLQDANRRTMPLLHRWVGTPTLTFLVQRAGGERAVTDSQSGYRAFRRSTMLALGLRARGMEYASEMLIRASQAGLRIADVPTAYRERIGDSKLNTVSDGWRHLRLILSVAPHLLLLTFGVAGLLGGATLLALQFHQPRSLVVGSPGWQPLFLSGVLMLLGEQALLIALVLWHRQGITSAGRRCRWIHGRRFPHACVAIGLATLAFGIGMDAALYLTWMQHAHGVPRWTLASVARIAMVGGASLTSFGLLLRLAHQQLVDSDLDPVPFGLADSPGLTTGPAHTPEALRPHLAGTREPSVVAGGAG